MKCKCESYPPVGEKCEECRKTVEGSNSAVMPYRIETDFETKNGGMRAPTITKGVKVTHIPTGNIVICKHHRAQHRNKATAIAVLELMLDS